MNKQTIPDGTPGNRETGTSLEDVMTPEERSLFLSFKEKIGRPVSKSMVHDLFFPLLNDGDIRQSLVHKWAMVNGDSNPLWHDPSYAGNSRWKGTIAPPMFLPTVNDGTTPCALLTKELIKPGLLPYINKEKYPNYRGVMQISTDWEFFEPVRPGDTIHSVSRPTDIYWKRGKRFRLLFCFGETDYTNQHGRRVAWSRVGAVYLFK
ncbi:MAG: MaoC family dehydratase N-terminal domain-containing protein [Dehalococcoidia bacterium]|nr:MaoC family dehydratase N-terminal domain-containing protein [Dehalococcoidia bacterium]